ncbi:MAG: DUF2288 domain-containing protein [Acaryochloridaceae cyanobacterium SU_2_1]|nr:DUF2288 domain-containing protein [Acaryochloridaceae cyanobacterium SU_2_1]
MEDIQDQLAAEIAEVEWKDLIPHAQRDAIIVVTPCLDLLEVGMAIAQDNSKAVQHWISESLIVKPSAQELSNWHRQPHQRFKTLIVQPFVLVAGDSQQAEIKSPIA